MQHMKAILLNPIRTGGVFHLFRGFLPITEEAVQLHTRNLVIFLQFNAK